jgi:hypothetical protein
VVLLETFVDPQRFHGTVVKASNWLYVGETKGFRRTRRGYSATAQSAKMVFLKPLQSNARAVLSRAILDPPYRTGGHKIMLSAQQMESLPRFFRQIPDPRRGQGRRHPLCTVLAIAAGAVLCGMRGYCRGVTVFDQNDRVKVNLKDGRWAPMRGAGLTR